jgi:hypothetical protein
LAEKKMSASSRVNSTAHQDHGLAAISWIVLLHGTRPPTGESSRYFVHYQWHLGIRASVSVHFLALGADDLAVNSSAQCRRRASPH